MGDHNILSFVCSLKSYYWDNPNSNSNRTYGAYCSIKTMKKENLKVLDTN